MSRQHHILTKDGLNQLKDNLCLVNRNFSIRSTAGTLSLRCDEFSVRTKKHNKKSGKVFRLFKSVEKSVNHYIIKKKFDLPQIKRECSPSFINKQMFYELPDGFEFYYVDIRHCYWRIAYLAKLIDEDIYLQYKDDPEFKLARNISLSILTSRRSNEYYKNGKLTHKISCYNPHYKTVYKNIRYTAYNFSGMVKEKLNGRCIGYHIDGFMIYKEDRPIVKKEMRKARLYYSTTRCKKTGEKTYLYGDSEKHI